MSCVDKILELYENADMINSIRGKIYFSKILIKLMSDLDEGQTNHLEVQNCLILLLNLASNLDAPDHYHSKGKNSDNLTNTEKQEFFHLLQAELEREKNN